MPTRSSLPQRRSRDSRGKHLRPADQVEDHVVLGVVRLLVRNDDRHRPAGDEGAHPVV